MASDMESYNKMRKEQVKTLLREIKANPSPTVWHQILLLKYYISNHQRKIKAGKESKYSDVEIKTMKTKLAQLEKLDKKAHRASLAEIAKEDRLEAIERGEINEDNSDEETE
jgi:hypothetical protein